MSWKRAASPASRVTTALVLTLALGVSPALASGPVARVTKVGSAPAAQPLQLVLPLRADQTGLESFARSVSTQGSVHYGQFQSIAQLSLRFGATPRVRRLVLAYLRRAGARSIKIDRTGLFADATVTAGLAQRVFATPLAQFRTARGARFLAPTAVATVPAGLRGLVDGVIGLDTRPLAEPHQGSKARRSARARAHAASRPSSALPRTGTVSPSACAAGKTAGEIGGDPTTAGFTPNQYLTAYGFDPLHNAGLRGQGERVALIEIDGFNYNDVKAFARCFHLDIPAVNGFGVGFKRPLPPGGESTLDLEVLDAAAPDLKAIDVYESKANAADTLIALTKPLQNPGFKPQVISASLGLCEAALLGSVGTSGIRSAEAALSMATATGITFLASSGDQGSADCTANNGLPLARLAVNYPSSSWWVTGVGGTNFALNAANQLVSQLVWNDTVVQPGSAGGGGASNLFTRPSYQKGTVSANRRAVPDVSLLADIIPGYAIYCTASRDCSASHPWESVGGTSAGTPLLAGAFALVDQQLRTHKRAALGLVNPLLYSIGRSSLASSVFSDVLRYDNDIGPDVPEIGHSLGCCHATRGFDEASGWGGVNVSSFASFALRAQPPQVGLSIPRRQKPVQRHEILVTVSCSLACRLGAFALVQIGSSKPFEVDSRPYSLHSAGRRTFPLKFSSAQLRKLRSGLSHHKRIEAEIAGVVLGAHNRVQVQSTGRFLRIRS